MGESQTTYSKYENVALKNISAHETTKSNVGTNVMIVLISLVPDII